MNNTGNPQKDFEDHVLKERTKTLTLNDQFIQIFGVRLSKFWTNNIFGFDVIKFDEFICPEENESTYDAIFKKFGQNGVDIIKKLLA